MIPHGPSHRVLEAVAKKEGTSPSELSPPLFSVLDPEALDALVRPDADSDAGRIAVRFAYLEYTVRVQIGPDVRISVQERTESIEDSATVPERRAPSEE